jgi:hypothetical protein
MQSNLCRNFKIFIYKTHRIYILPLFCHHVGCHLYSYACKCHVGNKCWKQSSLWKNWEVPMQWTLLQPQILSAQSYFLGIKKVYSMKMSSNSFSSSWYTYSIKLWFYSIPQGLKCISGSRKGYLRKSQPQIGTVQFCSWNFNMLCISYT